MTGNEVMKKMDRCVERVVRLEQGLFQDFYHACKRVGRGQEDREMKNIKDGEVSKRKKVERLGFST